jgi:scyllo-inositol 2-dehydrogenase (NADP+)
MLKMNIAINTLLAGFGMSGRVFHAPYLHTMQEFNFHSVVERHSNKCYDSFPYVKTYRSAEDAANNPDIELAVITTPNASHYPLAKLFLEAGKHVLVEKPMSVTSKEVKDLFSIANRNSKVLTSFQNRRYDGDFLTVKEIVKKNYLGKIHYFESHFDRYKFGSKKQGWRKEELPGSGVLYDLAPHLIDQALILFGPPESVTAQVLQEMETSVVDDAFYLTLHYNDKTVRLVSSSMTKIPGARFIIHGTYGSYIKHGIDVQESVLKSGTLPDDENWDKQNIPEDGILKTDSETFSYNGKFETLKGDYSLFYKNLSNIIHNNHSIKAEQERILLQIKIIESAIDSSNNKQTVKIKRK